ncbi:MAG TPA: glycosyltransferase [Aldersonia sp.]
MNILIATMPFDGHFDPLTGIAADLRDHGHDVRWYAGPHYQPKLDALGIPFFPFVRASEITGDNIADVCPERAALKGPQLISFDAEMIFIANVEHHFRDIAEIKSGFDFQAFFCDAALYAQALVAAKLDVPVYTVAPGPLLVANREVPPPFFGLRPPKTPVGALVHRGVRIMLDRTMRPAVRRYRDILTAEGVTPIPADRFLDVAGVCAYRRYLWGAPCLDFPQLRVPANSEFVGPLSPPRTDHGPGAALPAVVTDGQRTVVAVSQGTVDNEDPTKLIVPAIEALRADPDTLVVVTTGGKNTADLRRRFPEPNVLIEDRLPYEHLFDHADVFVTNGGAGSVLAAMRHGVPVVCAGKTEGKNDINARVGYNRLGIDLRTERPSARRIAAAVATVRSDEHIARNVANAREQLASFRPFETIRRHLDEQRAASAIDPAV